MVYAAELIDNLNTFLHSDKQREKFLFQTVPKIGCGAYLANSTKFLAPDFYSAVCGRFSLSSSKLLLAAAITGNSLYMLSKEHMKKVQFNKAVGYSVFTSVFFNFGSILLWMLSKTYLPENRYLLFAFGYASGYGLLKLAESYTNSIDMQINESDVE